MVKRNLTPLEKKEYIYYIGLMSACVNETEPPLPYDGINWQDMMRIAKLTRTDAMFAHTVLRLPDSSKPDKNTVKILSDIKNQAVFLDGIHQFEVEKILAQFEKYKIKNLPIKGYFVKSEYPQSFYRSICDFDILFDESQAEEVKKAFSEIGYEFLKKDDQQYHFQKKPFMFIEMHSSLAHDYEKCYPYLANQLDKSKKRENYGYSYEMSYDDHYTFMNVHASKHYRLAGMGLRMVIDEYLYYKNHRNDFDNAYLEKHLAECGVDIFEKRLREIAFKWFSPDSVVTDFDEVELYIILSNTLGRKKISVMVGMENQSENKKKSKLRSFLSLAFPNRSKLQHSYPFLEKYPFLLPYAWVKFWIFRLFKIKNVNFKSVFTSLDYDNDDLEYYKKIQQEMGFDKIGI